MMWGVVGWYLRVFAYISNVTYARLNVMMSGHKILTCQLSIALPVICYVIKIITFLQLFL